MNDNMMFMIGGIAGVMAIAGIILYNGICGVASNLANAKVGEVYNFEYEQPLNGQPERVFAKVILPVHTLSQFDIERLNLTSKYRKFDPVFHRTKHLVTCQMENGQIRNFYAERTRNVKRTLLGNHMFSRIAAVIM